MMGEACVWVRSTVPVAPGVYQRKRTHRLTGEIVFSPGWWVRVQVNGTRRDHKCATEAEAIEARASMQESVVADSDAELAAWLDRYTVLSPDGMVSRKDFCVSYNAAAEAGRPAMTTKAFYAAVRRLRPTVKSAQRGTRGDEKYVLLGLTMKEAVEGVSDIQMMASEARASMRVARRDMERLMERLEWPEDEAFSRAIDACVQIEEACTR